MRIKKRFIILPILIIMAYTAYWFATIQFIEDGFMNWVTNEIKNNQADIQFTQINRSGFPLKFTLTVDNMTYSQKAEGLNATIPTLTFTVNPLNWYSARYAFPKGANIQTTQSGQVTNITVQSLDGYMITPITKTKTDFNMTIGGVNLNLPATATLQRRQVTIDQLNINLAATPALPRVLNENNVTQWRTQNGVVNIAGTGLIMSPATLDLSGALTLNTLNQPEFNGHTILVNGAALLNKVSMAMNLPDKNFKMARSFLLSFEKSFANPDGAGMKLPLIAKGGFLSLGPIPVMPLPQIQWDMAQ